MHDPTTIEAMARAMCLSVWGDELHWTGCRPQATAALSALCTLHPGVCAILSGEAVAVPRIATWEMCEAARDAGSDEASWGGIYTAFISRSPYAKETPDDR